MTNPLTTFFGWVPVSEHGGIDWAGLVTHEDLRERLIKGYKWKKVKMEMLDD